MPSGGNPALPREYAKCKNRAGDFMPAPSSVPKLHGAGDAPPGILAMTDDPSHPAKAAPLTGGKPLTPAAQRALAEAEARRKAAEANATPRAKEFHGPKGPEPTRYGDWEKKGIASDF
jgi:hypothetical protein